jgi:hypothetical protein
MERIMSVKNELEILLAERDKLLEWNSQAGVRAELAEDRAENAEEKLFRIRQWCDAYPLAIWPEPDFEKASDLLKAGGMAIDGISASCMRHVLNGIKKIIDGEAQ